MPNVGPMELIIVLIIALVVLGPKKLPEAGRSVGRGIREFKNSLGGDTDDAHHHADHPYAHESPHLPTADAGSVHRAVPTPSAPEVPAAPPRT